MAVVDLTPQVLSPVVFKGAGQSFITAAVQDFTPANVNFTSWTALTAKAIPAADSPVSADVTFGTVTGTSAGVLKLVVSDTDLASVAPGTSRFIITGKAPSSSVVQLLAQGVLTVNLG